MNCRWGCVSLTWDLSGCQGYSIGVLLPKVLVVPVFDYTGTLLEFLRYGLLVLASRNILEGIQQLIDKSYARLLSDQCVQVQ